MNTVYTVLYSKNLVKELTARGADNNTLKELADAIIHYKRQPGLDVDTSDNTVSCYGYPISFIRDHNNKKVILMTNGEAIGLDVMTGDATIKYSRSFIATLEELGAPEEITDELDTIDE